MDSDIRIEKIKNTAKERIKKAEEADKDAVTQSQKKDNVILSLKKAKEEADKRVDKIKNTAKERIKKAEEAEKDSQEGEGRCRSVSPREAQPPSLSLSRRRTTSFSISLSLSRRRTTSFSLSRRRRMPSLPRRRRLSLPSLPRSRRLSRRRFLIYNHSQFIGINFSTHQLVFTFIRFCQLSNFIFAFLHISNIILAFLPISYLPIFVSTGRPCRLHNLNFLMKFFRSCYLKI